MILSGLCGAILEPGRKDSYTAWGLDKNVCNRRYQDKVGFFLCGWPTVGRLTKVNFPT